MNRFRFFIAMLLAFSFSLTDLHAAESRLVVRSGDIDSPKIALTFDDGPHPRITDRVLDLLEEYDIPATFFVIGENAALYPEPLKRAAALGHEIGNHTFCHKGIKAMSVPRITKELSDTKRIITSLTGAPLRLFRPPEGTCTDAVLQAAESGGYTVVLWTVDTNDWALASTDEIVSTVMKSVRGGSILLFHDYTTGDAHTLDALKRLIPDLLEKGYEFVTVSELIA